MKWDQQWKDDLWFSSILKNEKKLYTQKSLLLLLVVNELPRFLTSLLEPFGVSQINDDNDLFFVVSLAFKVRVIYSMQDPFNSQLCIHPLFGGSIIYVLLIARQWVDENRKSHRGESERERWTGMVVVRQFLFCLITWPSLVISFSGVEKGPWSVIFF